MSQAKSFLESRHAPGLKTLNVNKSSSNIKNLTQNIAASYLNTIGVVIMLILNLIQAIS